MTRTSHLFAAALLVVTGLFGPAFAANQDFDASGHSDILWRNGVTGANAIWLMKETTLTGGGYINEVTDFGWSIAGTGDFDGDGKADILWRHTNGNNAIWLMNGTTLMSGGLIPSVTDMGWSIVGIGDFNGDGKSDILWRHTNGNNAIWFMNGLTMTGGGLTTTVTDAHWTVKGVGDFNGDGKSDILWRNGVTGENSIWLMNGLTLAGGGLTATVADLGWDIVGLGDFDGDGKSDILWRHTDGNNAIWLMNGTTLASGGLTARVSDNNWHVKGVGDFNGDGKSDILWRNAVTFEDSIWLMNGVTLATGALTTTVADPNWDIVPFFPAVNVPQYALTVATTGNGTGTVARSLPGPSYPAGSSVTLTATSSGNSLFVGWSGGGCSGIGTCTVTMSADKSVSAIFFTVAGTWNGSYSIRAQLNGSPPCTNGSSILNSGPLTATFNPNSPNNFTGTTTTDGGAQISSIFNGVCNLSDIGPVTANIVGTGTDTVDSNSVVSVIGTANFGGSDSRFQFVVFSGTVTIIGNTVTILGNLTYTSGFGVGTFTMSRTFP